MSATPAIRAPVPVPLPKAVTPPGSDAAHDRLQALVDQAVALGFPDAREAEIYVGEITVRQRGPGGARETRYPGAHAHLRDGRWLVQLAYPLAVVPGATEVDTAAARLVTGKVADIMCGFERYPHSHPMMGAPVSEWLGPDLLPGGTAQDRLGGQGAACAVLIAAVIHQNQGIPYILDCLPLYDHLVIGPKRLLLCTQRQAVSATIAAHDRDFHYALVDDETPEPPTVMAYALSAWFAMNLGGLPAPFATLPQAQALAGATAMIPPTDLGARAELRLRTASAPTGAAAADALALRLATWRTSGADDELDVAKFSRLADSAALRADPHAVPDWARGQLPAFLASRFGAADLPDLIRSTGDLRPSRWVQVGHRRTIGDQALRAIASVLGFDPRTLVPHPLDAPWDDEGRQAVAAGLARWASAHALDDLAGIRRAAAPDLGWMQVGYLLKAVPEEEAVPLLRLVVQRWHDGPPEGFDDVELLDLAAADPDSDHIVSAWPVTGPSGPLLAFWRVQRGLPVALEQCLDSALTATPRSVHAPSAHDVFYAMAHRLDAGMLAHLHDVLAADPLGRSGEALVRCCLEDQNRASTASDLWSHKNFDARLTLADELVHLALLSQLLGDLRPLPADLRPWAEALAYYRPSGFTLGEAAPGRPMSADARIADCAGVRAIFFGCRTLAVLHGDNSAFRNPPQDVYEFDPNEPLAKRDARLARMREYVRGVLGIMLDECGIGAREPAASANGF